MTADTPAAHSATRPSFPAHEFAMRFTSTPRGARLARRMVAHSLDSWGHPYDSAANDTATLVAAELTANAVRHGHVPGRDFLLRLTEVSADPSDHRVLRGEVTDPRTERAPTAQPVAGDAEAGRGLLLVARLADRWGWTPRPGAPGKTVWAELDLTRG